MPKGRKIDLLTMKSESNRPDSVCVNSIQSNSLSDPNKQANKKQKIIISDVFCLSFFFLFFAPLVLTGIGGAGG